jgi:hypothetical protein
MSNKKPNEKQNFFQNYNDHLNHLKPKYNALMVQLKGLQTLKEKMAFINNEAPKHLSIFEKLRDGHDYCDEVMGATVVPAVMNALCFVELVKAIWEGAQALAIRVGLKKDDTIDHKNNAVTALVNAASYFLIAAISFFKSIASLVVRPFVTLVKGWEKKDTERFAAPSQAM